MKKIKLKSNKQKKLFINTKNMGIDIDKNEYQTIVQSHTNYPEKYYR